MSDVCCDSVCWIKTDDYGISMVYCEREPRHPMPHEAYPDGRSRSRNLPAGEGSEEVKVVIQWTA